MPISILLLLGFIYGGAGLSIIIFIIIKIVRWSNKKILLKVEIEWVKNIKNRFDNKDPLPVNDWINDVYSRKHIFNKSGIYILTNDITKEAYIGQSKDIGGRIRQHFMGGVFHNYINQEGWMVRCEILKKYNKETLNQMERDAIKAFKSKYKLLNRTEGNK